MASNTPIVESQIIARFDTLVQSNKIFYDANPETHIHTTNPHNFQITFTLHPSHAKKPLIPGSQRPQTTNLRPGSDIDTTDYEITTLGDTHILAFNKFAAARPHLLILTSDGWRRQDEELDEGDWAVFGGGLSALNGDGNGKRYLGIFNCGVDSGCSRVHKHFQVFGVEEGLKLWPDGDGDRDQQVPFEAFLERFEGGFPGKEELGAVYARLLGQVREVLGVQGKVPHNVVLDRGWMLVVPRRKAGVDGVVANAAAFVGLVWVESEERLDRWAAAGVGRVLAEVGVPRNRFRGK